MRGEDGISNRERKYQVAKFLAVIMAAIFVGSFSILAIHARERANEQGQQQIQRRLFGRAVAVAVSELDWWQEDLAAAAQKAAAEKAERARRVATVAAPAPAPPKPVAKPAPVPARAPAPAGHGQWWPIIQQAAAQYAQDPAALYRVMMCESTGDPNADNGVCKGLFQFNPGTWRTTPYGHQSIWDGRAQIFAAAWMWSVGRKSEWTCR